MPVERVRIPEPCTYQILYHVATQNLLDVLDGNRKTVLK